jgi:hypothetical protein
MDAQEGYRWLLAAVKASARIWSGGRAWAGAETRDQPNFALYGDTLNRMRNPVGDGANQRRSRPRDGAAAAGSPAAGSPATGSSVFAPGYDANRPGTDRAPGTGPGRQGSSRWYGSTTGGTAGKGPVRGYPPVPGQPPPMYPPGQFAAWNRGRHGVTSPAPPGQPDRGPAGDGLPGQTRASRGQPSGGSQQQAAWQSPTSAAGAAASASRYYEREDSPEAEPGYSMLAVSDPAADVTSTQTWQAVGDGRATGIWTAPARPGTGPSRLGVPPARRSPEPPGPDASPDGGPPGAGSAGPLAAGPLAAGPRAAGTVAADGVAASLSAPTAGAASTGAAGTGTASTGGTRTRGRGHSGAHTGPHATARAERAPRSQRPAGRKSRGKRPASVKLAMAVALLLVLVAGATLAYGVLRAPVKPKPAAASKPKITPSAAASPTVGPYGLIGSRKTDPQPLTAAQLFPPSFTLAGQPVTRTTTGAGKRCAAALDGASIRSAVRQAGCDQVVRATYLAASQGLMGTIGVLNLSTASGATKAARAADASDFISQLRARHGPTRQIGDGTGIEEAAAKGHYLILIWAEFTSLRRPKTAALRTEIETFMTELRDNTANVSLTNRMLNGTP